MHKSTTNQRWRSAYCLTPGVTCSICYRAGKRGADAWLFSPDEFDPRNPERRYVWASPAFNAERRRRMLKHLREQHPNELSFYFPTLA